MISASKSVGVSLDQENEVPSLELTPLIDIVFIVIVFLLITANAPLLKLPVDIPDASANPSADLIHHETLVITVYSEKPYAEEMHSKREQNLDVLPSNSQGRKGASSWAVDDKTFDQWSAFKTYFIDYLMAYPEALDSLEISIATDPTASAEDLINVMSLLNEYQLKNVQILMKQPD